MPWYTETSQAISPFRALAVCRPCPNAQTYVAECVAIAQHKHKSQSCTQQFRMKPQPCAMQRLRCTFRLDWCIFRRMGLASDEILSKLTSSHACSAS